MYSSAPLHKDFKFKNPFNAHFTCHSEKLGKNRQTQQNSQNKLKYSGTTEKKVHNFVCFLRLKIILISLGQPLMSLWFLLIVPKKLEAKCFLINS